MILKEDSKAKGTKAELTASELAKIQQERTKLKVLQLKKGKPLSMDFQFIPFLH